MTELPIAAGLVLSLLASGFLLLPTLGYPLGYDHGVLHYLAWTALRGWWPYAQSWDTTFPGVLLIHFPAVAWGGDSALSLRVLDLGMQLVTVVLMFEVGRQIRGSLTGVLAALMYAGAYASGGYYHTAQRDGFIVPLLLGALLLFWRDGGVRDSPARLAGAGFALGLAALIRPTYGLIGAAAGLFLIYRLIGKASLGRATGAVLWFGVPLILPTALFFGAFLFTGKYEILHDTITYLMSVYAQLDQKSFGLVMTKMFVDSPQVIWLGIALLAFPTSARRLPARLGWVLALFAMCMIIRFVEAKTYRYQFWPPLAFAALASAVGWSVVLDELARTAGWGLRRLTALALVIAFIVPTLTARAIAEGYRELLPNLRSALSSSPAYKSLNGDSLEQAAVARYLHENTSEDEPILLWGPGPMVYYSAQRVAVSRFFITTPFLCVDDGAAPDDFKMVSQCKTRSTSPVQERFRQELITDITTRRPKYIVAASSPDSLKMWEGASFAPDFPELRSILQRDYHVEKTIGRWALFRLTAR